MNKLDFWNNRAKLGKLAGTKDLIAKKLEMDAIASYVKPRMKILDFGCGNGMTAFHIASQFENVEVIGIDFSEEMIKEAKKLFPHPQIHFMQGDIEALKRHMIQMGSTFDLIYTERMLINLKNWEEQKEAIETIGMLLTPNGKYIMCENSWDSLKQINRFRVKIGLEEITEPWHNHYIRDIDLLTDEPKIVTNTEENHYSSTYYFLSRVVNAFFAKKCNGEPLYDSDINKLALELPALNCSFGQGRIWVWERK